MSHDSQFHSPLHSPVTELQPRVSSIGDFHNSESQDFRVRVSTDLNVVRFDDLNNRTEKFPGSDTKSKSLLSEFDDYVAGKRNNDLSHGFEIGDMVRGKVKSHPLGPGHIYNGKDTHKSEVKSNNDPTPLSASSNVGTARTEEWDHKYHASELTTIDPLTVGNPAYELYLTFSGRLGRFLNQDATNPEPIRIPIVPAAYNAGVYITMYDVLRLQLREKTPLGDRDIDLRATNIANRLTDGIMIMTYLKLRSLNFLVSDQLTRFFTMPNVPDNFEIPEPFALAISQLGVVKISSLSIEKILCPTIPSTMTNFGLKGDRKWNPAAYLDDVVYAKSVGIRFCSVDLQVNLGSSWWIYRIDQNDETQRLICNYPHGNYTPASAVLYTLFYAKADRTLGNAIFNFEAEEANDYGSMLCKPYLGINVATYYAIESSDEQLSNAV